MAEVDEDDDVSDLDMKCPICGSWEGRSRPCTSIHCEDGEIDDHEEDPVNSPVGSYYPCPECRGVGWLHWCSGCGYTFTAADFERVRKENPDD